MKVLFFEGAGCEGTGYNDVPNCRIRTAFHNNEGKAFYVELSTGHNSDKFKKEYRCKVNDYMYCASCHEITDDPEIDDCNYSRVDIPMADMHDRNVEYTLENIRQFVNKWCGCSFDQVIVLHPTLSGYYAFGDRGRYNTSERYNFMEDFEYRPVIEALMKKKRAELRKLYSHMFGQRFDNTSYWNKDGVLNVKINVSDEAMRRAGVRNREYKIHF